VIDSLIISKCKNITVVTSVANKHNIHFFCLSFVLTCIVCLSFFATLLTLQGSSCATYTTLWFGRADQATYVMNDNNMYFVHELFSSSQSLAQFKSAAKNNLEFLTNQLLPLVTSKYPISNVSKVCSNQRNKIESRFLTN